MCKDNQLTELIVLLLRLPVEHRQQNEKKPRSVHATYLVAGTLLRPAPEINNSSVTKDLADELMQSSPYRNSQNLGPDDVLDESPELCITLVREEDLDGRFNQSKPKEP